MVEIMVRKLWCLSSAAGLLAALLMSLTFVAAGWAAEEDDPENARQAASEEDLRFWLENMHVYHGFTPGEMSLGTGLSVDEIKAALKRFDLHPRKRRRREPGDPLTVLPYPGGRHPRLDFLDGAVRPQRETKISVFTPWDPAGYVVVDVPEAIWSNLGLTYLAHTHVPTIWTEQQIELEKLEWRRHEKGVLGSVRRLPNGISFAVKVTPGPDVVQMEFSLTNGTDQPLTGLRNQMCVMLGYAPGFGVHTTENRVHRHPYAACRSEDGTRWIITAWNPCHRLGGNSRCPCLHSNPQLADCPPGATVKATGYLWFYEGDDLDGELGRLAAQTGWAIDPDRPGSGRRSGKSKE